MKIHPFELFVVVLTSEAQVEPTVFTTEAEASRLCRKLNRRSDDGDYEVMSLERFFEFGQS